MKELTLELALELAKNKSIVKFTYPGYANQGGFGFCQIQDVVDERLSGRTRVKAFGLKEDLETVDYSCDMQYSFLDHSSSFCIGDGDRYVSVEVIR